MAKKSSMGLGTINTILNTAPLIIQGATKLIKIIKDRKGPDGSYSDSPPSTLEGLKGDIEQIQFRLDGNDESNIEQIKLIEQLAKQNETLAESLRNTIKWQNIIIIVLIVTLFISLFSLLINL